MADSAPPNYNPNDSMLSGGIDTPIMKVMGGGGGLGGGVGGGEGTAPNGYNETQSLLSGGIDTPIIKVEGGGESNLYGEDEDTKGSLGIGNIKDISLEADKLQESQAQENSKRAMKENYKKLGKDIREERKFERRGTPTNVTGIGSLFNNSPQETEEEKKEEASENIRFIKDYKTADINEYNNFIASIQGGVKLDSVISKLERQIEQPKKLHYIRSGNKIEISSVNSKNDSGYEKIKFISTKTKEVIVLPPITNPEDFFNMILFLKQNGYLRINGNIFKLQRKCFVVHCSIDLNNNINKYFYLKIKVSNSNYEIMNSPYKIVYPKQIDGSKGLLFSNIPLSKVSGLNDLRPTDFDAINEYNISIMYYTKLEVTYNDDEFSKISAGDNDTETPTNYSITLQKNIVVIDLIDEDPNTINVDINGNIYRIRVPILKSFSDRVYNRWLKNDFTTDEKRLIADLYLDEIPELENKKAEILFQLTYFKCFNDVSLLTKSECTLMREYLEIIYQYTLTKNN